MTTPTYDRELIAQMLDEAGSPSFTLDALREQAKLLRAADNADAAGVRTVNTTGPVRAQFEAWAVSPALGMDISRHPADDDTWAGQYIDAGLQRAWEAWQAALASAPPSVPVGVDDKARRLYEMIFDAIAEDGSQQAEDACIREIASALAQQPAPIAAAGAEWNDEAAWSLAARAEASGAERDSDDNGTWWTLRIEHFNALAQQPEAPAQEAVAWRRRWPDGNGGFHGWILSHLPYPENKLTAAGGEEEPLYTAPPAAQVQQEACAHSWHDFGVRNNAKCFKCGSEAVCGYEDRPYTGQTHPAADALGAVRGSPAKTLLVSACLAGRHSLTADAIEDGGEPAIPFEVAVSALETALAQAPAVRVTDELEATKRCALKYLEWLGIENPEKGLSQDVRDPEMCGEAAIGRGKAHVG